MMGGFGRNYEKIDFSTLTVPFLRPIYILTGQFDDYYATSVVAKEFFEKSGCKVKFTCVPNVHHKYLKMEREIYHFFVNKT